MDAAFLLGGLVALQTLQVVHVALLRREVRASLRPPARPRPPLMASPPRQRPIDLEAPNTEDTPTHRRR